MSKIIKSPIDSTHPNTSNQYRTPITQVPHDVPPQHFVAFRLLENCSNSAFDVIQEIFSDKKRSIFDDGWTNLFERI
ncbi:MAG: hypothetical protein KIT34_05350 [Cyanobacteria bacterium TGS_CYA1]|nr:hypothetical protein [Cyanobacteria bacterium TGS_CYA1]